MTAAAASAWGTKYEFSLTDLEQFAIGLLEGAIEAEVPDVMTCIKDGETLVSEIETTYADFRKETFSGVKDGIEEIGTIVKSITSDITDCKAGIHGIENLVHMAESFSSPWSFAYHVGKDLLVNGVQIYHEVDDAIAKYESSDFKGFGDDIGKALAQVFVGEQQPTYGLSANDVEVILVGIVEGALQQSLPDFTTCMTDIENTAHEIETAINDFEKESFSGVKAGIEMIGTVVSGLSTDLDDCKEVITDVKRLDQMAKTFKSPWSFAYHVGKDLVVDGTDIFHKIEDSLTAYGNGDFHTFGVDIGDALSLVLIGEPDELGQMVATSSGDIEQVLLGIIEGAINQSIPSIDTCVTDITGTAADVEEAVADFKKETLSDVEAGIRKMGDAVSSLATDLDDCHTALTDVERLDKMAKTFKSPLSFAYHVGHDLIVDGQDIFHEVEDSITAYDAKDYHTFGFDMGKALALVLVGNDDEQFLH